MPENFSEGIRLLIERQASSEEFQQYIQSVNNYEQNVVEKNLKGTFVPSTDTKTGLKSAMKALGWGNPATITLSNVQPQSTESLTGADAIEDLLGTGTDIPGRTRQMYVVGHGLTNQGVKMLGKKLAAMTIGDVENMLDVKNIDPLEVFKLMDQLRDLYKALLAELIDAIIGGDSDVFKSTDLVLEKQIPIGEQLFKMPPFKPPAFPVGGILWLTFEFEAALYCGLDFLVGVKVIAMKGYAEVVPRAGALAYAELKMDFFSVFVKLRLEGHILGVRFPTKAEIAFNKFPLDVGIIMNLELKPVELKLQILITQEICVPVIEYKNTVILFKANLWEYSAPMITEKLIDSRDDEKDMTAPSISNFVDDKENNGKVHRSVRQSTEAKCLVRQIPYLDYTEPQFEISIHANDDRSGVNLYMNVGTVPGGTDVLDMKQLAGPSTILSEKLSATGVPLYFTIIAENDSGQRSHASCYLSTYDVTLPSGRFDAGFVTSSNPEELIASLKVYEDSELVDTKVGVGYGKGIWGDQIVAWKHIVLDEGVTNYVKQEEDPLNMKVLQMFTQPKSGKLVAPKAAEDSSKKTVGDCARACVNLPATKCMSFNYDFGNGLCELIEGIEGFLYNRARLGLYDHYERLGVGKSMQFNYKTSLKHNMTHYFNFYMRNVLGYQSIINTKGVLIDLTVPLTGKIENASQDYLKTVDCLSLIPETHRPDWVLQCTGVNTKIKNNRLITDGVGSRAVFNGPEPMTDLLYTRANRYLSANWDGFIDRESGILGYTVFVGHKVCEDLIHPHHDPHKHFFDKSQWTNIAMIYPIPDPYQILPDGQYFITVRALNGVEYGGPLATTVCHSTLYTVDNSPPFVWELYDINYNEETYDLTFKHNSSDLDSGLAYNDVCLGRATRDCNEMSWTRLPVSLNVSMKRVLSDGVHVWVKIRAVNKVDLRTIRVADQAIIVDKTPPVSGIVLDGPIYGVDLVYTKDFNELCSNWLHYYDPESGIAFYLVSAGSEEHINVTDIANVTQYDRKTHGACIPLKPEHYLEHGRTYYTTVWAYNGAIIQRNTVAISNGVIVDLTKPVSGEVVDGNLTGFEDLKYSGNPAKVEVQWKDYYDPESGIRQYNVQVEAASNGTDKYKIVRNWVSYSNETNSAKWLNFHFLHNDNVRIKLKTTNGALNTVINETNGFIVDLTPPRLEYLGDGIVQKEDQEFQSDVNSLSANFKFIDEESGLDHYKVQVYQTHHGIRYQILPGNPNDWIELRDDPSRTVFIQSNLALLQGGLYSVRVGAINKAGFVATYETTGVVVDTTPPTVQWIHVNTLSDEEEEIVDGYVQQADTNGIKASWYTTDHQSGIVNILLAVGTSPGGTQVLTWTNIGTEKDKYIDGLTLDITEQETRLPVYYVTMIAVNGAGLRSLPIVSTPIMVMDTDTPGLVIDGTDCQSMSHTDIDYQFDMATVGVVFTGFTSHLHGIMAYEWAIGTSPGGQDIQTFSSHGVLHTEEQNVAGNGLTSSGYAQANVQLEPGITYYSTVRGVTNAGNVIEAVSDGFTVDDTEPVILLDRLVTKSAEDGIGAGSSLYMKLTNAMSAMWHYSDTESSIQRAWYSVGTYPYAEDISVMVDIDVSSTQTSHIEVGTVKSDTTGKPNIISIWVENKAGLIGKTTFGSVIIDTTEPGPGYVSCPQYIGTETPVQCSWSGFLDEESPINKFVIALGSEEGYSDISVIEVNGFSSFYTITGVNHLLTQGKTYFVTVTAVNIVELESYAYSEPIAIDTTPPKYGKVVDLHTTYRIDASNNTATVMMNAKICTTDEDCKALDATCSESLSSVSATWQPFTDDESGIVGYQIAIGTTPGGGQVKQFFDISKDMRYYTVNGLNLKPYRKVYISIRGTNGAGLSSVASSNGIYMSYLSQGLPPLSHVGINDVLENSDEDIDFQESSNTYRASWDVSGDPCPVVKYEWQIERLGGDIVVNWLNMGVADHGLYDGLQLRDGELYYSVLKVTNALNYTYIIRSNGVTIKQDPLLPGKVFDGFIPGYDLNFIPSSMKISANWDGFGLPASSFFQADVKGNPGLKTDARSLDEQQENQKVAFYEVAVGTDRRFPKSRDNIVPFTNVGRNKSVTFYDLSLESGTAVYYFTVKAYSASYSVAMVTSNGFHVGFDGGVIAGTIKMADYLSIDTYLDLQFEGFSSKLDILMYYVAISNHTDDSLTDCKNFIDGHTRNRKNEDVFNVVSLININLNTFCTIKPVTFQQGHTYYAWVIGVDESGGCGMTYHQFLVDVTPPLSGSLTAGPFYNMELAYTSDNSSITMLWKDFSDPESDIAKFEVSLLMNSSCHHSSSQTVLVDWIELTSNYSQYSFIDLYLIMNTPYTARLRVTNKAGLHIVKESSPVLYDPSVPKAGKVVGGADFTTEQVWFSSTRSVTGSLLHLATPFGSACPSSHISMVNDAHWKKLQQIGLKDPSDKKWSLVYRAENVESLAYDDAISIKLARDSKQKLMFTGAYYQPAHLSNGGIYRMSVKPAVGANFAVTEILFWDGPEDKITTYDYVEEDDWTLTVCQCCLMEPVPESCTYCNCSSYLYNKYSNNTVPTAPTSTTTVKPSNITTKPPYNFVNNPDNSQLVEPVDTSRPVAQPSCGVQMFSGQSSKIVAWCRSYNDSYDLMRTAVDFPITQQFYDVKIVFHPEIDDAVYVSWCLVVYVEDKEITDLCGIPSLSTNTRLFLHVFSHNNFIPAITDRFNIFSSKAYFKDLVLPPQAYSLCRYGDPFRGGTSPILKYEVGIGSASLLTDIATFRDVIKPCIPCYGNCSKYNCDSKCDPNKHVAYSFTLTNLNLVPFVVEVNETGHYYNKTLVYYFTVKAISGSGTNAIASSSGFYIDPTPPVYDLDMMLSTPIYVDVLQGEFMPVKYQSSNNTIKAFWRCYDDESLVKESLWAIGVTIGGVELQPFQSVGRNQTALNSTFDGVLQHNTTYYVSIICVNGGGLASQWNDSIGVIPLLESPMVDDINSTVIGAEEFPIPVTPSDAKEAKDPTTVGITFTASEDPAVKRYDMCIGTADNLDNIFPCTWVGYNMSGSAMIKDGCLYVNDVKVRSLSELRIQAQNVERSSSVFRMEPGRTMFMTLRICNEAMLCSNKSLGTITITDEKAVLKTSEKGESIEMNFVLSSGSARKKREINTIIISTPKGLVPGQSVLYQPLNEMDLKTEYRSDSSPDFQPYIVNPWTTSDMVERLLYRRILDFLTSFSLVPVGHLAMPGPINITYTDSVAGNEDNATVLAHWNTAFQQWEISSRTCAYLSETINTDGTKTVQVCKTQRDSYSTLNGSATSYYSEETQFGFFLVTKAVYNVVPYLASQKQITMTEDEGTLQYQLEATDEDNDPVKFYLKDKTYRMGNPVLYQNGLLLYTPCKDCSGEENIVIIMKEESTDKDIKPTYSEETIIVNVVPFNDPPEMFITQYGMSVMSNDPTEPVLVYLEQKNSFNKEKWSEEFSALLGAYDVERHDLYFDVEEPKLGKVIFSIAKTAVPELKQCPSRRAITSEPCGNFSSSLPHHKDELSWIYATLSYKQNMSVSGNDFVRIHVTDSMNATSSVLAIQFVLMESPCQNAGICKPKRTSNYPCTSIHRAENFDMYYDCVCASGWTGIHCTQNVDECLSSPCEEPYVCYDEVNSYRCDCPIGDPNCEVKAWTIALIVMAGLGVIVIVVLVVHLRMKKKNRMIRKDSNVELTAMLPLNQEPNTEVKDNTRRSSTDLEEQTPFITTSESIPCAVDGDVDIAEGIPFEIIQTIPFADEEDEMIAE